MESPLLHGREMWPSGTAIAFYIVAQCTHGTLTTMPDTVYRVIENNKENSPVIYET